jgi:hypothetical protein
LASNLERERLSNPLLKKKKMVKRNGLSLLLTLCCLTIIATTSVTSVFATPVLQQIIPPPTSVTATSNVTLWGCGTSTTSNVDAFIGVGLDLTNNQSFAAVYTLNSSNGEFQIYGNVMRGLGFNPGASAAFRCSAAITDDYKKVVWGFGWPNSGGSGVNYGVSYVFLRNSSIYYNLVNTLQDPQVGVAPRLFGRTLDMTADGTLLFISSSATNFTFSSSAYLYNSSSSEHGFNLSATFSMNTTAGSWPSNVALSADGRWLAIAALNLPQNYIDIYNASSLGFVTRLSVGPGHVLADNTLGFSMAFSHNGNRLNAGATTYNNGTAQGAALIFGYNETAGNWSSTYAVLQATEYPFNTSSGQGYSVSLCADGTAAISNIAALTSNGTSYSLVFNDIGRGNTTAGVWNLTAVIAQPVNITGTDANMGGAFTVKRMLSSDGTKMIISAPYVYAFGKIGSIAYYTNVTTCEPVPTPAGPTPAAPAPLSGGAIAGIVLGSVAAVAIIGFIANAFMNGKSPKYY